MARMGILLYSEAAAVAAAAAEGVVQDMTSECEPDSLLSILAEMAERDELGVGADSSDSGGDGKDVWMGGGGDGDG